MQQKPFSIVWLRRDLRLHDHETFAKAASFGEPILPVFVFDTDILARFQLKDDRRLTLIVRALISMHTTLKKNGGGVLALHGSAKNLIPELCKTLQVARLVTGADYEPSSLVRDEHVQQTLGSNTPFLRVKDHLIFKADEVLKDDGTPYRVFTPYSKAWRQRVNAESFSNHTFKATWVAPPAQIPNIIDLDAGEEAVLAQLGYVVGESEWTPAKASAALQHFIEKSLTHYKNRRDFPATPGTSRLSPYLRFGLISVRECARAASLVEAQGSEGASTWMNELIWREFFSMILTHFPHTPTREFQSQYVGLGWRHDREDFARFCAGQTGYPIVDAGMRELLQTGFIHNRSRMIVASFMTKDLLLDWRLGEEHFAQYLMDYEQASNVGGWQWAASTGTDAQPYFRIFNPVLQSQKFDPDGEYIRRFVPELAHLSNRDIHEPWKTARPAGYPAPMVDHAKVKDRVLSLFKNAA